MKRKKTRHKSSRNAALPSIDLSQPLPVLAAKIGRILKSKRAALYMMDCQLVTVDERGNVEEMTPERFTVWVGKYMTFTYPKMDTEAVQVAATNQIYSALVLKS